MAKVLLVSYDLNAPGARRDAVNAIMKDMGGAKIVTTTWLVLTERTAESVRAALAKAIDANDQLLVVTLTSGYASSGLPPEWETWIEQNVGA